MPAPAPDPSSVELLLTRAGGGAPEAVGALLETHRALLRQVVGYRMDRLMRSRVDESDVVQEASARVAARLDDYLARRPMPFHLWVRKTAQECLIELRRKHVEAGCRAAGNEVPLPDRSSYLALNNLAARDPAASKLVRAEEAAALVRRALAALPDADREIILLRNYEGLSNAEAAAILDIDISAASKRYARALLKLRQLLNDEGVTSGAA
jgi:RNA polymerase sigma-70 factor (ECF subfamily)